MRLYYRSALEKAGFEVEQAINGIEAMEKVLSEPFHLMIVDVNMPRMDGFTFLRSLRSSAGDAATIPALMISTESEKQDVAEARAAGANFYLVKPVAEADWFDMLASLRESHRERPAGTVRHRGSRPHPAGHRRSYRAGAW